MRLLLLFPLWLAVLLGDPGVVHVCPLHSATPHAHQHHAPASDTPDHRICTCIDSCGIATNAALPTPSEVPAAAVVRVDVPAAAPASTIASRCLQVRLPWSNGPPPPRRSII